MQSVWKKNISVLQRYLVPTFKILSVVKHSICFAIRKTCFHFWRHSTINFGTLSDFLSMIHLARQKC